MTHDDLIDSVKETIYTQDYTPQTVIEGVKIVPLKTHVGEDGDFGEIIRMRDGELEAFPGFKLAQVNKTYLYEHSIKAWHVHFKQDEIWYVPPSYSIFAGLWDIRKNSPTANATMRLTMGSGSSQLVFIPHGVAHGSANFTSKPVNMLYFVNHTFNSAEPDERRIHWDALGSEFWSPAKD